jgi:hypothetical protein
VKQFVSGKPGAVQGALFDFANTVVELITDPPSRLSGETLRMELDDYRAYAEAHRPPGQV